MGMAVVERLDFTKAMVKTNQCGASCEFNGISFYFGVVYFDIVVCTFALTMTTLLFIFNT
jgi:hypothetical protein